MPSSRILIVEDEDPVAEFIDRSLRSLGYQVLSTASSGEAALRAALDERPDLVLMDIGLKGATDGIAAAREIRSKLDIPVVFITGLQDEATLKRATGTDPSAYIIKPFEAGNLRAAIEVALHQHRGVREKLEKVFRKAEEEFRALLKDTVVGIFRAGTSGDLLSTNPSLAKMLGYESCEEFLACVRTLQKTLVFEPGVGSNMESLLRDSGPYNQFELQAYRKDGSTIWVSGNTKAVRDVAGKVLFYEGSLRNIPDPNKPVAKHAGSQ